MKHYSFAKHDCISALRAAVAAGFCQQACLLVDLEGKFRVLVHLAGTFGAAACKAHLEITLPAAGEVFWTGQIWMDREKSHPDGRLSPTQRALYDKVWHEAKPVPGAPGVASVARRYSKETWFADADEVWKHVVVDGVSNTPPIVSFYSFKGGVGRSTTLASIAIQNARAGRNVLLIDFDLEAPGIASIFPPSGAAPEVGLVDYLLEQPLAGNGFDPSEAVYIYDDKNVTGSGEIRVVPSGVLNESYLDKLARLNYLRLGQAKSGSADSPLSELLKELKAKLNPDLILIDSRAGLDDIGGLALSSIAHYHVLFGTDTGQSWAGLRIALDHIGRQRILAGKEQLDCLLVQAQVNPQNAVESKDLFRSRAYQVFTEVYYDDPSSTQALWPVPDEFADEQPHFPSAIVHDYRLMGYNTVSSIADYLCESDYRKIADRFNSLLATI